MSKQMMTWPEFVAMPSKERKDLPPEKLGQAAAHRALTDPAYKLTPAEQKLAAKWLPAWEKKLA